MRRSADFLDRGMGMHMSRLTDRFRHIGPGALVAAAFIGPGTITTCTVTGASFGYSLLWAMLFSVLATMVLQEMSARLGVVTGKGLGENLRGAIRNPVLRGAAAVLVIAAIFIGNTAYETGNIAGGLMGIGSAFPALSGRGWGAALAVLLGFVSFALLWSGSYRRIEKFLVVLVLLMSVTFLATAIVSRPDWGAVLHGLFVPRMPDTGNAWFTVVGLIGTTAVPYNLFLHASAVGERFQSKKDLPAARFDAILSVGLGGLISAAVIIGAAAAFYGTGAPVNGAGDMAHQLEPLLGSWAKYVFAAGLFAAGFSSTVTAPLAAAFAVRGMLGWPGSLRGKRFRGVWCFVLAVGVTLAALGQSSPVEVILLSQAANALVLPVIAFFLTVTLNSRERMGAYKNRLLGNLLAFAVVAVTVLTSTNALSEVVRKAAGLFG